jgi:hypothetical protein
MNSNKKVTRDASYFQSSGALLLAVKDWVSVPENFPYGLGALILNYLLYQSELVPRWLSVWGLVGGALMLAMGVLRLFGHPVMFLALPIVLNEMVLAVWLIVVGFNSSAIVSTLVGVLFITALVSSMLNGVFIKPINNPDYLTAVSANENKVSIGVLFQLTLTASVVAIPIVMFPILRGHSESLALGYVGARIFEGFFDAVIAISLLLLLTLSREFVERGAPDASYFQTSGALLLAVKDWSSVPENFPYGLGALILNYILYQSELIPRWLSGWGLVGGALMLAMGLLRMFGYSVTFLALPIIVNEMVLAVRLIVIGFNSSAIASESVKQL